MKNFWNHRRVFVTGATGTVGPWMIKELLSLGSHVVALVLDADPQSELCRSGDIERVTVVNGRLEDFRLLERTISEQQVDTVFHLGAQSLVGAAQRSPLATFESNIRGTYNLLEACRLHGDLIQRVVVASSDKAYGEQSAMPCDETMPLDGRHPYEVSKSCADLISRAYHHTYDLPLAVARCGNLYGGGDLNWSRLIPGTVRSLLGAERPIIRSDGTYVREYLYVQDIVRAYLWVAECIADERVRGQAFNFGTQSPMTVLQVVHRLQRLMGREDLEPEIRNDARGEIRSQRLSSDKAREILHWAPVFDLDTGLRETINWYRDFLTEPKRDGP